MALGMEQTTPLWETSAWLESVTPPALLLWAKVSFTKGTWLHTEKASRPEDNEPVLRKPLTVKRLLPLLIHRNTSILLECTGLSGVGAELMSSEVT